MWGFQNRVGRVLDANPEVFTLSLRSWKYLGIFFPGRNVRAVWLYRQHCHLISITTHYHKKWMLTPYINLSSHLYLTSGVGPMLEGKGESRFYPSSLQILSLSGALFHWGSLSMSYFMPWGCSMSNHARIGMTTLISLLRTSSQVSEGVYCAAMLCCHLTVTF